MTGMFSGITPQQPLTEEEKSQVEDMVANHSKLIEDVSKNKVAQNKQEFLYTVSQGVYNQANNNELSEEQAEERLSAINETANYMFSPDVPEGVAPETTSVGMSQPSPIAQPPEPMSDPDQLLDMLPDYPEGDDEIILPTNVTGEQ